MSDLPINEPTDPKPVTETQVPQELDAGDKASKVRFLPELDASVNTDGMSKRQIKKLRKTLQYEQTKDEWKKELRKREKAKREARKQAYENGTLSLPPKPKKIEQTPSGVNVVLDMDFEPLMLDKEVKSVVQQVGRSYAANKRCTRPVHVAMTSIGPKVQTLMNQLLRDHPNWKMVDFHKTSYMEAIEDKSKLVYLTADSPNIIQDLEVGKYYIVGGIVDKNRHKNLTFNKAKEHGIATAQLPISEYVQLSQRKVLAVNHVFEILVEYLECKDWKQAFEKAIPPRKLEKGEVNQTTEGDANDEVAEDDQAQSSDSEKSPSVQPETIEKSNDNN